MIVTFFSFVRGISYFRLHTKTRYLVNMIIQVFLDIRAFLTILTYSVITFSMIEMSLNLENDLQTNSTHFQ